MNKFLITLLPLLMVITLLFTTCSKGDGTELIEFNQQSQLELPKIGSDYYNFIVEISKPEYDDIDINSQYAHRKKHKDLRKTVDSKWTTLINDSGLTKGDLEPVFKHFYKYNIYEFKSTFLHFKYGYLLEQFYDNHDLKDKCNGLPCSSGTGIKYLCNRISLINDKIKDIPLWKSYDIDETEWYGANPYNRNKKILINGGKLSSGRHLKLKEKTLDRLIFIANAQNFDQLPTKERKIGRFYDYSKYIYSLESSIKNLKDTQTSVINNWEPDNPAHINVCNNFN